MNNTADKSDYTNIEQHELRGFSRSIAEIEWLVLLLCLLYFVSPEAVVENRFHVVIAMVAYTIFFTGFRYFNFFRRETRWKLALETWVMIAFITGVLWTTGKVYSPLLNLYLLVIITAGLTLGKLMTLLELALIAACYLYLGYPAYAEHHYFSWTIFSDLMAKFSPFLLAAYLTTMLSADLGYARNKLKLLSETDEMTGFANRRAFNIVLESEARKAERYARNYSVLMIDADNLKGVNDNFGHEAGDQLIKVVGTSIKESLRAADLFARLGGDEFAVLLPEANREQAKAVADRIRTAVASTSFNVRNERVSSKVSVGGASYPEDGNTTRAIMDGADRALYESKSLGGNCVTL